MFVDWNSRNHLPGCGYSATGCLGGQKTTLELTVTTEFGHESDGDLQAK